MTEILNGSKAFLMTPASAAHDIKLLKTPKAILLLGEIVSMLNVTGSFYMSNKALAKRLHCSISSIDRYLNILEANQLIKREILKDETGNVDHRRIYAGKALAEAFTKGWQQQDEQTPIPTGEHAPIPTDDDTPYARVGTKENINKESNKNRNIYSPAKAELPIVKSEVFKEIIDYLNQQTGKTYRYTTKATQTLIKSRLNEDFTVADFKKVINNKCATWLHDAKMVQYLRPQTLFGTKFESYLNEKVVQGKPHVEINQEAFTNGQIEGVDEKELPF